MSAFSDSLRLEAWPYQFKGSIFVEKMAGGTPADPKVAESWIKTKIGLDSEEQIQQAVAQTMMDLGITADEAAVKVNENRHLNKFKRDEKGLYYEGRCLKAAIKEAVSVAVDTGKLSPRGYGINTRKGALSFVAEHVFVVEDKLHLGVDEPQGVIQKFVHTFRGSGIQYEEYVEGVSFDFTVITDKDFSPREWAMIWLTAEQQGIGASRSQGWGRFKVTEWNTLNEPKKKALAAK